jgi:hypothetical protein
MDGLSGGIRLQFDSAPTAAIAKRIRRLEDIPDILTMNIPAIEYLVDGIIARETITLWTGSDNAGKTFLMQSMAVAVAVGGQFLGRVCRRAPVLYLDYENPSFVVQERFQKIAGGPIDGLHVWGTWNEDQPPQIANELLLTIAKESKPLIIVDPFRYAHGAEENDSTEMMSVMQTLRYYAAVGGAVVILHHPAKSDGSTGRGSSAIKGAVDVAFLQELSDESGLISLKTTKNRFGAPVMVTIRPDFAAGRFDVCDSPKFTKQADEMLRLRKIIEAHPGASGRDVEKEYGGSTKKLYDLLKAGEETHWTKARGSHNGFNYFPCFSENSSTARSTEAQAESVSSAAVLLSPLRREAQQRTHSAGFRCEKCGACFDTSAGRAQHQVHDCKAQGGNER